MQELELWGWNAYFQEQWQERAGEDVEPARVVEEQRGAYRVVAAEGERWASISGRLRYRGAAAGQPAVGDWVLGRGRRGEPGMVIDDILSRRTKLSRKVAGNRTGEQVVAANVDAVLLVSSLNREFNLRRIERYLALVWESGARPVVVLNKADLCPDPSSWVHEAEGVAMGVPVHVTSAISGAGLEAVGEYLRRGQTVALLGSSGVGKSTLINALLGTERQPTAGIRDGDDRGRHTTTSRQLLLVPSGGLLLDTPGLRELQLWDSADGLGHAFADIEAMDAQCRFSDCRHSSEPGCAVRAAIENGTLDAERLHNYRKLEREQQFLERKRDAGAQAAEKRRWKAIHKAMKQHYKNK